MTHPLLPISDELNKDSAVGLAPCTTIFEHIHAFLFMKLFDK